MTSPSPSRILVTGTGRMALSIARTLNGDPRFAPLLAARDEEALRAPAAEGLPTFLLSGGTREALSRALRGVAAVIHADSAISAADVARGAAQAGCHYLDIAENPASAAEIAGIAQEAAAEGCTSSFVPACGLAPGYVTALVAQMLSQCDPQTELTVYVGVLPATRSNRLGYGNIWGIDGLLDEYTAPCLVIRNGALTELPALDEHQSLDLGGETFEAFTTAGSLDGLARQHAGKVNGLIFKTLRYPGHLDYMQFLMQDLGLGKRLYQLRNLLMNGLPRIEKDRVIIAIGKRSTPGEPEQMHVQTIAAQEAPQGWQSAVSIATAAHVCAVADILCGGHAPRSGLLDHAALTPTLLRDSPFFAPLLKGSAMLSARQAGDHGQ